MLAGMEDTDRALAPSMPVSQRSSRRPTVIISLAVAALLIAIAAIWVGVSSANSDQTDGPVAAALPDETGMGPITLNVNDLELLRTYYVDAVGLSVLSESDETVELGFDTPLITLQAGSGGEALSTPNEAGLYHSAILYPNEAALASVILNLATLAPQTYQGSADHAVSLAFYFVDPEGNGLELYVDRPASEWVWNDGEVQMGSAALDPNTFITEHLNVADGLADDAIMGHVHMKVGDLEAAEAFYADTLGFAVTARSEGALFYAAGGYHHHLATNVWQSPGAGERSNTTGLGALSVTLPTAGDLAELEGRLKAAGVAYEAVEHGLIVVDPWGNEVRVLLQP